MKYHVYDNWLHDRVVVHRSKCKFCNDGKGRIGVKKDKISKNGEWLSVCNTFSEAKTLAKGKGREETKSCCHCFKDGERFIL